MVNEKLLEKEVGAKITNQYDGDNRTQGTGMVYEFDNGEEWLVFDSYDDAEYACQNYVEEQLDDEPELFNQEWLSEFVMVGEGDRRIMAGEQASFYLDDIRDEDDGRRIIEEANLDEQLDELEEKRDNNDISEEEYDELKEKLVDEAYEKLEEEIYNRWYEGLEDPIDFLVNEEGIYSQEDLLKQSFIQIDTKQASINAVNTDGVAHFFSSYDGNQVELPDGSVMYRLN